MKKIILTLAILLAAGYGGFHFWEKWQAKQHAAKGPKHATTAKVQARDIRFTINAAGDIGPADQVSVRPEVNGKIAVLPVDIGDEVKKGDLLFTLDDSDLQIQRASRLTDIEGAKLEVEKTKRNFDRIQKLFADKLISQEAHDDARTEYDLAKNSLNRAQQALNLVEDSLSKTKIVAPFDCTVLTRPVSVGQAVSGSGGFNSGTEVMTIANLNDMIILAHINQADVTRVAPGASVDIEVDSVPGLKMKGVVERIAPQATVKNNLKGFSARIALKKIDSRVRPGMTANIAIPVASANGVLSVPLAAVFTEEGERFCYVKNGETMERRPVHIGVTDYSFAEVTSGLSDGEIVSLLPPAEGVEVKKASDKAHKSTGAAVGMLQPGKTNTSSSAEKTSSTTQRGKTTARATN